MIFRIARLRPIRVARLRLDRRCVALLLLIILFATAGPLSGADAAEIRVEVIHASNTDQGFDTSLARIHRQLSDLFNYSTYNLLEEKTLTGAIGTRQQMALPAGRSLEITPVRSDGKFLDLHVVIRDGPRNFLDTDFRLAHQGTILVGGPRHDGGVLIIAITAGR